MGNKNCTKSRKFYITLLVFYCIFYNSLVYANITNTITITAIVPHRVYNPLTSSNIPAGGFSGPVTLTGDSIIFKGIAHPKSVIKLTQDGVFTATVQTKEDSSFEILLKNISTGTHNFGIQATDIDGRKSLLLTYSIYITSNLTTTVNGLLLPPTLGIDKSEVKRGDILTVMGRAYPQANIQLIFNSSTNLIKNTIANAAGLFVYKLNTMELDYGNHEVKAKIINDNEGSYFSEILDFKVGNKNVLEVDKTIDCSKYDLNCDKKINLVDFSIMAYWFRRSSPPKNVDLNNDGKVDLSDFSILAYRWTG